MQTVGLFIRDTPVVSVSKKQAPATTDKSKGIDLLSGAALLEDAQMKKVLKRSKRETLSHQESGSGDGVSSQPKVPEDAQMKKVLKRSKRETRSHQESGSGDGVSSQPKVPGELQDKTVGTDEGTGIKPRVLDVPKDQYEGENKSWRESGEDDDGNDDDSDDDNNDNSDDDDVNVKLKDVEHGKEWKGDAKMTDAGHDDVTQETTYDQVKDDAHFLNLDNVPPTDNEIVSMMNVNVHHEELSNQTPSLLTIPVTVIPKTLTASATTIPLPIPLFIPPPHQSTPTHIPTTTTIPVLPNFSSLFEFNQRVYNLEKGLSELKQADQSAQLLTTIKS
nr:hypothetical protein [Tanacetum cinerariifolium]